MKKLEIYMYNETGRSSETRSNAIEQILRWFAKVEAQETPDARNINYTSSGWLGKIFRTTSKLPASAEWDALCSRCEDHFFASQVAYTACLIPGLGCLRRECAVRTAVSSCKRITNVV